MLCSSCGRVCHPLYAPRCEDCWALAMHRVFGYCSRFRRGHVHPTHTDHKRNNHLSEKSLMKGWM